MCSCVCVPGEVLRQCSAANPADIYVPSMTVLYHRVGIDSISRDERGFPLTQYITNGRISRAGYTITHSKHHHRVLRLIFNRMSI